MSPPLLAVKEEGRSNVSSPPLLAVKEEGRSNVSSPPLLAVKEEGRSDVSSPSVDFISHNDMGLKERNYLGLSDSSSVHMSSVSCLPKGNNTNLNLEATELRLGLPGSQSPERDTDFCLLKSGKVDEKPLFPLLPSKDGICSASQRSVVTGYKRGFADTMDGFSGVKGSVYTEKNWMFCGAGSDSASPQPVGHGKCPVNLEVNGKDGHGNVLQDRSQATNIAKLKQTGISNNNSSAPAAKAQVVGWPPIRSFRTKTLATSSKNSDEVDGKPGPCALFVKVSMNGAPYLRKVDLRTYSSYRELSTALKKMFSCFTLGQCASHGASGKEVSSKSKWKDLLNGSEYVVTYEDKDGDWMLVGDVPWEMFIETCKRLKIMKSADAIGLAPRGMEKSKIDQ